jgi:hypothetical protein
VIFIFPFRPVFRAQKCLPGSITRETNGGIIS